jgi:hypothetical protein
MFNKHFYSLIACCTLALAIVFSAFTPSNNLVNQVKIPMKSVVKTDPNTVDCSCTFTSGGCADCTCVGGFATGCGGASGNLREGGKAAPIAISMSANQMRQALKYQRFLLSLDSPESIAAASEVSQLIEAMQDGKTAVYQQAAEQYNLSYTRLPKAEKEMVDVWTDHKKKIIGTMPEEPLETGEKPNRN